MIARLQKPTFLELPAAVRFRFAPKIIMSAADLYFRPRFSHSDVRAP